MGQLSEITWTEAHVVLDGANVAGDGRLPGCSKFCWERVDAIKKAWQAQINPSATFTVFMDTAPGVQLGSSCKRQYQRERDSGGVIEVDFADPEILLLAERTDAAVITGDYFKDARREHPWLEGNRRQFFEWSVEHGHIMIVPRDMGTPSDFSKTRAEERSELKGKGADIAKPAIEKALRMAYRCDNEACWLCKYDPGHYTGVPDLTNPQEPRCTACRRILTVLGEAPRLVQLKFADSKQSKLERRTFPPGTSFVIGRDTSDELVSKVLAADIGLVSRQHARIDWDGSLLSLTDLGSKNGTTIRRWTGKQNGYEPAVRITGTVSLSARDEVCLAGVLVITRSARSFTLEPETMPGQCPAANPPTVAQESHGA